MHDGSIQSFCDRDQMSCGKRNCVKKMAFLKIDLLLKSTKTGIGLEKTNILLQQKHAHKCKADILSTSTWSLSVGPSTGSVSKTSTWY